MAERVTRERSARLLMLGRDFELREDVRLRPRGAFQRENFAVAVAAVPEGLAATVTIASSQTVTSEQWSRELRINLDGAFLTLRTGARHLVDPARLVASAAREALGEMVRVWRWLVTGAAPDPRVVGLILAVSVIPGAFCAAWVWSAQLAIHSSKSRGSSVSISWKQRSKFGSTQLSMYSR